MKAIKVMIVDDSAVVRQVLTQLLARESDIEVIAAVADPVLAAQRMKVEWPDVMVLDVEMPRMDGITFLRKIMAERPTPVIICSTLTEKGTQTTLDALAAGAVAIIAKPKLQLKERLRDSSDDLLTAIRAASQANVSRLAARVAAQPVVVQKHTADVILSAASKPMAQTTEHIVAIGTSTGGTQALESVLTALPRITAGIVIVQHMPAQFTAAFAERLNSLCEIEVREARDGDRLVTGRALIAPGGRHMLIKRSGAQYMVEIRDGPAVNRHRPSVDVLFRSVAKCAGRNATGIILTGMGDDGARGLKEMQDMGAATIAQDEASCVVFGMPKEAIKLGAADRIMALHDVPGAIMRVPHGGS